MRAAFVLGSLAWATVVGLAACDDGGRPAIVLPATTGSGSAPVADAGTGGGTGGSGGEVEPRMDGGTAPVRVGVSPNPRAPERRGGRPAADELRAELEAIAAGSRVRVVSARWSSIDAAYLDELEARTRLWAGAGVVVIFELAIVDGVVDARPEAIAGAAWDDPATKTALETTVGDVLARFGPELAVVSLGRDADRYLAEHPAERAAYETLVIEALSTTRAHPSAPRGLLVGAGFRSAGAMAPDPSFPKLLEASDVAVVSHAPLLQGGRIDGLVLVPEQLDQLASAAGERPIVLSALAYPSSEAIGSSPAQQANFFIAFFDALALRRAAFPWVNVVELNDRAPEECDAIAAEQGEPPGGALAAHSCSLGLFDVASMPKPSWESVKSGLATFASP